MTQFAQVLEGASGRGIVVRQRGDVYYVGNLEESSLSPSTC